MDSLAGAIRYAVRQFWSSKVFTATAILTLALGIGGTTAIFTLIHAVMLRSLPVADPASLYRIGTGDNCCVQGSPQKEWGFYSFPLYERLKAEAPEFERMTAFQAGIGRLAIRRERVDTAAKPLRAEYVTGSYFATLGIGAFGGRLFTEADDRASASPVVVVSHHAWQTAYGSDATLIGSTLVIEGYPFTVVGVAPPGFFGDTLQSDPPDVWIPIQHEPLVNGPNSLLRQSTAAWLRVIGRLRPGASTAGLSARLTGVLRRWIQDESGYPAAWMPNIIQQLPQQTIDVVPAGAGVDVMKEEYTRSLQILFAVCGLVLLVACANVANLLLARAAARRSQTALRLAIGASRAQIVGQALVESVILALAGAVAGLAIAWSAARLLLALAFTNAQFLPIDTRPSAPVLAFAIGVALVTGIVFGAAPAWFATRTDPIDALRGSGRGASEHASLAQQSLLVLQATLSVVLVAGATMLARSLNNLEGQDLGYQVRGRVLVVLHLPPATYTLPHLNALYRQIEEQLRRLPGVRGCGLALYNPLTNNWSEGVVVAGHPPPKPGEQTGASWDRVSPTYLQDLGMTLQRGRWFTDADNETAAPVAIVNEAFVRRFFRSDEDPFAQRFGLDLPENASTFRIVGIVRDAKFAWFTLRTAARPMLYVPLAQNVDYPQEIMKRVELGSHFVQGIVLVSDAPPGVLEPLVGRTLSGIDPNLTITTVRTLQRQVELSFDQERAVASLAGLFGLVALALAAVGLYGITAYTVARRANEIGIRMALGADRAKVVDLVLRGAMKRVGIGLLAGIPLAVGAGRLIAAQLYGVSYWDPVVLVLAAASLSVCAAVAALIPAGRAAAISPMSALRAE